MNKLHLIVARSRNNVIGVKNTLPWHLPADLKYFKQLTTGHAILMGRSTYESIGKPLPHRENLVVSRNPSFKPEGVIVFTSLEKALDYLEKKDSIAFIIGGDTIYKQTMHLCHKLYITEVDTHIEDGSAFFPNVNVNEWKLISSTPLEKDEKNPYNYSFDVYEKIL